jgi:hypothetical protein
MDQKKRGLRDQLLVESEVNIVPDSPSIQDGGVSMTGSIFFMKDRERWAVPRYSRAERIAATVAWK